MIIKTRLAFQSSFYRLTAVDQDTTLEELLKEILQQWNLPSNSKYALLWRESDAKEDQLILDKSKEWHTFCRLQSVNKDEIVELHLIQFDTLTESLQIPTSFQTEEKSTTPLPSETNQSLQATQSPPVPAPKFAFHSVDPQPIGARKSYGQMIDEEAKQQKMQRAEESGPSSPPLQSNLEEGEEMSAYDRVMARSRLQGEGLNMFFGSLMANRAGHTSNESQPIPEAVTDVPVVWESTTASEEPSATEEREEEEEEESTSVRVPRSQEEIDGMNDWLGNAWEKRLKEMGHGASSGSPYAKLRLGKGKERQENLAPEASTSQLERGEDRVSHSEEAREVLAPLQESYPSGSNTRSINPSPSLPHSIPTSRSRSRPGSASGLSFSGSSTRKARIANLLRRGKGKGRISSLFATQPPSISDSGTVTPISSENRRSRKISFRSLSEALLRETQTERSASKRVVGLGLDDASVNGVGLGVDVGSRIINDDECGPERKLVESNRNKAEDEIFMQSPPTKERNNLVTRPTLLRAAYSAPLTSTAVNLSPAGGITLHMSSLAPAAFALEEVNKKENLFDLMLPRELRIKCFQWLARLHEEDVETTTTTTTGNTTIDKQSRYSGKEAAAREFIRLTRVSQTWQSLLLDGQLWTLVDTSLLCNISNASLLRLTRSAGPFIRKLTLQATPNMSSLLLVGMSLPKPQQEDQQEQQATRYKSFMSVPTMANLNTLNLVSLTHLNLKGSRGVSTKALHNFLVSLPSLTNLNVSNTDVVTDDTCLLLGSCLPNLLTLDVSRCFNLSGKGLLSFIQAGQGALYDKRLFNPTVKVIERQEDITLPLQELRAAACVDIDCKLMESIGKCLRSLQVLDLSYVSDLKDEAIAALVSHPGPTEADVKAAKTTFQLAVSHQQITSGPFVTLTPRQAGGNIETDEAHHRRLLSSLRHISFSSCRRLTDRSCIFLAHAVPNLQFIELANIGANLHDEGLVKLFETTPRIQRIDLEGAGEITEKVLEALTPNLAYLESIGETQSNWRNRRRSMRRSRLQESETRVELKKFQRPPPPGAELNHLILSHVLKPDSTTLLNVVRRCPRLTNLQLDDTKANDEILKEFVHLSGQRQLKGSYISLVDCRALSRNANSDLLNQARTRPREGRRGRQFEGLEYTEGPSTISAHRATSDSNHQHHLHNIIDECDENLVVVKTFFNWEIRSQQRRIQKKRKQRLMLNSSGSNRFLMRSRRDSLGAALSFLGGHQGEDGEGNGRWSRITNNLIGQGDEAEDARGCVLM